MGMAGGQRGCGLFRCPAGGEREGPACPLGPGAPAVLDVRSFAALDVTGHLLPRDQSPGLAGLRAACASAGLATRGTSSCPSPCLPMPQLPQPGWQRLRDPGLWLPHSRLLTLAASGDSCCHGHWARDRALRAVSSLPDHPTAGCSSCKTLNFRAGGLEVGPAFPGPASSKYRGPGHRAGPGPHLGHLGPAAGVHLPQCPAL